jgi:hypothetical protein
VATAMRLRKLRIAWSVVWGMLCVLLIAFWVRSYWSHDEMAWDISKSLIFTISSHRGELAGQVVTTRLRPPMDLTYARRISMGRREGASWKYIDAHSTQIVFFPYWCPTLLAAVAAIATTPLLRWRYSLRTLLIATTLIAVVLGLAVSAASK